jgi:hypothetical protein
MGWGLGGWGGWGLGDGNKERNEGGWAIGRGTRGLSGDGGFLKEK